MSEEQKKSPADTLRESNLKAAIWENQHEKGVNYNTTFSRSYQDQNGEWQQSNSFGENDLLKLANLATRSNDRVQEMRQQQHEAARENERQNARSQQRDTDRGR